MAYTDPHLGTPSQGNGDLDSLIPGGAQVVCLKTGCPGAEIEYGYTGTANWVVIPGAQPIWRSGITASSPANGGAFYFVTTFTFSSVIGDANITFTADNGMKLWLDGNWVTDLPNVSSITARTWNVTKYFGPGPSHEIKIWGANDACSGCNYRQNPAMVTLRLEITPQ